VDTRHRRADASSRAALAIHLAGGPMGSATGIRCQEHRAASRAPAATFSGRYFDGLREKRLPSRLLDAGLQDAVVMLGESLVVEAEGAAAAQR
jgi:hypothetical protein